MASESFLENHWEKLVFAGALVLVVAVLAMARGQYFAIENPTQDVDDLTSSYGVNKSKLEIPVQPAELTGVSSFAARLGDGEAPAIRQWTFYNYTGFQIEELVRPPDPEFRLPQMALEAEVSPATGTITVSWNRAENAQTEHPRAIPGRPAEFDLALKRYDLAEGSTKAYEVFRGANYKLSVKEELGTAPRSGVPPIEPGRTYRYYLELKIGKDEAGQDLKLAPGATREMTSAPAEVTTPVRYEFRSMTLPARGAKSAEIGVLGGNPVIVKVRSATLAKGVPIPIPEEQQEEVGAELLPFRPLEGTRLLGPGRPLHYYDLQRSLFGIHYVQDSLLDTNTVPEPGSGGSEGEGGGGTEGSEGGADKEGDQPPGQPEDDKTGEDAEDEFPIEELGDDKDKDK